VTRVAAHLRLIGGAVAAAALLTGCVINPVPEGYNGTLAHVTDSVTPRNNISADFFYLAKINGFTVPDSLSATDGSNRTPGAEKPPVVIGRDVPTTAASFTIVAHTRYTTPVYALTNPVYDVSGDVSFTPLASHDYVVKGVLGPDYSAVWVEDRQTGQVAAQKIEVRGSAALGTLGKLDLK
jgi:hypothetical protein